MSFILDALRKSERERQKNEAPGIAGVQSPGTKRGSGFWLPLVALLIGVNLSLLLVMWIMTQPREAATPETPSVTAPVPAQEPVRGEPPLPAPAEPTPALSDTATPATGDSEEEDRLPTLDELLLANAISIAPMRLDIHVYSDKPEERFVFINMNRYNEGDTMAEGPLILSINEAGVVMRYQGQDFQVLRE